MIDKLGFPPTFVKETISFSRHGLLLSTQPSQTFFCELLKQVVLTIFPFLLKFLAFMMMVPLRITIPWSGFSTIAQEVMDAIPRYGAALMNLDRISFEYYT
jgi:hypothetical protein